MPDRLPFSNVKASVRHKLARLLEDATHARERDALLSQLCVRLESIERAVDHLPDALNGLSEALATLESRARDTDERLERVKALSRALLDDVPRPRRRI